MRTCPASSCERSPDSSWCTTNTCRANYGEVLPHLLFGDLSRFTVAAYRRGQEELAERIIGLMERLLRDCDDPTRDLVGVSFVATISPRDVQRRFFAVYGPLLRTDLKAIWGIDPADRSFARTLLARWRGRGNAAS